MTDTFNSIIDLIGKHKFTEDNFKYINKTKAILKRELNPEDSKAKFGLETFLQILPLLNTEERMEISNLLKPYFPTEKSVPQVKVRKKHTSNTEEPKVIKAHDEDKFSNNYNYEEGYNDEPVGKLYTIGMSSNGQKLPNGNEKRTRKNYTHPSYAVKEN